jgi:hypothetical protein
MKALLTNHREIDLPALGSHENFDADTGTQLQALCTTSDDRKTMDELSGQILGKTSPWPSNPNCF